MCNDCFKTHGWVEVFQLFIPTQDIFRQLPLSEGTSTALRILNKGREYLMPEHGESLEYESAQKHSGELPEQSRDTSSNDSSWEKSESSSER